jgi:RNA polymerase sigma-70 factor (ECF subfamily)
MRTSATRTRITRLVSMDDTGPVIEHVGGLQAAHQADAWVRDAYDAYEGRIHGLALAASRDADVAADVTQEAFLRLVTEARKGRFPEDPGAWLYRVAANLLLSRGRRLSVAQRFARRSVMPTSSFDTPESMALGREEHRVLNLALARLTLIQRTAVVLAAHGLTGDEIAVHIGRSSGATRSLLLRTRRQLRREMEREGLRR